MEFRESRSFHGETLQGRVYDQTFLKRYRLPLRSHVALTGSGAIMVEKA